MPNHFALASVPDDELLERLSALLGGSRRAEADLVAQIGEVDFRRLYARAAAPSMFAYCTEVLHLSEAEAYLRIATARAARQHPQLLAMLGDGRLHLSAIAKLSPHLTAENCDALLRRATHRSKRQVEELVAELRPRPDVPCLVRRLPERRERTPAVDSPSSAAQGEAGVARAEICSAAGPELRPDGVGAPVEPPSALDPPRGEPQEPSRAAMRAVVEPLAPSCYKVQFTASTELREKLERLQALMRAEVPDADLVAVIDRAVTQTLRRLEARRYARTAAPRTTAAGAVGLGSATSHRHVPAAARQVPAAGRHIPAAVRRAVFERDGGRCRYRDERGRRCPERHRLEYHHLHPFAMGGGHTADNVRLMCRSHNLSLAEHDYGLRTMAAYRKPIQPGGAPSARKTTSLAVPTPRARPIGPRTNASGFEASTVAHAAPKRDGAYVDD